MIDEQAERAAFTLIYGEFGKNRSTGRWETDFRLWLAAVHNYASRHALTQAKVDEAVFGVPKGWQLVPIKPSEKMFYKCRDLISPRSIWEAMLAAAPKPPR